MNAFSKTRILHIIKGLGRGGAERLLVSTTSRHSAQYSFHIVYFLSSKDHLVKDLKNAGVTVHHIQADSVAKMFFKIWELIQLIRQLSPHLLHAHLPTSGFVALIASIFTRIPLIYSEHNLPSRYKFLTRLPHLLTLNLATKIIAVSQTVKVDLLRYFTFSKTIFVIENGIDLNNLSPDLFRQQSIRKELNIPDDLIIIGTVAVFTQQKRLDRWLEICKRFHERYPRSYFILAGHGPLMDDLKKSAGTLIQKGAILFTGRTNIPETWIAAMDIYLMTSDYEGMPVAMLEAMGMAKPIVSTSVGGIPTVIETDVNGLLYSTDEIEDAVHHLERLHADPDLRKKLGQNARELAVRRFDVQRMVGQLEELYSEVLT